MSATGRTDPARKAIDRAMSGVQDTLAAVNELRALYPDLVEPVAAARNVVSERQEGTHHVCEITGAGECLGCNLDKAIEERLVEALRPFDEVEVNEGDPET